MAIRDTETKELKARAVELLALGVIPFEQWAHVFANPQLSEWDGLRAKAFAVWFPTMLDFLKGEDDWKAIQAELDRRGEAYGDVFERTNILARHYRAVLPLFSEDEQIFIRDRRLQNVHGRLHIYQRDEHKLDVFDPETGKVKKTARSAGEYRDLLLRYYPKLRESSKGLLNRLLESRQFSELSGYYNEKLRVEAQLVPLIEALGVGAAAGSE